MAASTRGRTIQLQPSDVLRDAGTLDSTIHHELLHMLIESYARAGTPLWFREGLVLYLAGPKAQVSSGNTFDDVAALEKALRAPRAKSNCGPLMSKRRTAWRSWLQQHGKQVLLDWVQNGLPTEIASGSPVA